MYPHDMVSLWCSYRVHAVCNHSGSLSFGHYTAAAKHCADGNWYSYNDARCAPCDPSRVVSGDNYILFLEQERAAPPRCQTLSAPEDWPFAAAFIPAAFRGRASSLLRSTRRSSAASSSLRGVPRGVSGLGSAPEQGAEASGEMPDVKKPEPFQEFWAMASKQRV